MADPACEDQLVVGFREPVAPRGVRLALRSGVEGRVRVALVDVFDRRFGLPTGTLTLPPGRWTRVDVTLSAVLPEDDGPALDPARLDRLILQDVTAHHGDASGENEIWLDDFEVF